jgi:hypothetical protein
MAGVMRTHLLLLFLLMLPSSNAAIPRTQLGSAPPRGHFISARLLAETVVVFAHKFAHFPQNALGAGKLAGE